MEISNIVCVYVDTSVCVCVGNIFGLLISLEVPIACLLVFSDIVVYIKKKLLSRECISWMVFSVIHCIITSPKYPNFLIFHGK